MTWSIRKETALRNAWRRCRCSASGSPRGRAAALARVRRNSDLAAIRRELESLRKRVRRWPLRRESFDCLERGLRRSYRRGRAGQAEAYASGTDEAFHEWRKRAKDLRYQAERPRAGLAAEAMDGLRDSAPRPDRPAGRRPRPRRAAAHCWPGARRLSSGAAADGVTSLIERIDCRRSELQAEARPLGARIYSEKGRAFSGRVGSYWEAWRMRGRG